MRSMFKLAGFSLAVSLVFAAPAMAAGEKGGGGAGMPSHITVGAGFYPDYEGSASYEVVPYMDAQFNYGNYFARFESAELSVNIVDSKEFHFGPMIGYRRSRADVSSNYVSRMEHISYSITSGAFIEYEHTGEDPRYGERLTLNGVTGTFHEQTGWTAILRGVIYRPLLFINPGLIASLSGDATWGSGRFMQTYFGVNAADSAASGLPRFNAGSGLESYGVGVSLDQYLSRHWSVGMRFHYARLTGDAADSPVTAIAGNPNQFYGGLTLGYVF